jgi:hypothetical protein
VGHHEDPVAPVRGTDACSRKYERPDGVAFTLQVSAHAVERQSDEPRHVLSNNPTGPELAHDSKHLRPEPAVIARASLEPGTGEGLAREPAREERGLADPGSTEGIGGDGADIAPPRHLGPVPFENREREVGVLDLPDGAETRRLGREVKPADPGEEAEVGEVMLHP